jgi:hypothetical protein
MFFKPDYYREIVNLYNEAEKFYHRDQYIESAGYADRCIPLFKLHSFKMQKWFSADIFLGNLYLWRAIGKSEQIRPHRFDFDPGLLKSTISDFRTAGIHLARENIKLTANSVANWGARICTIWYYFW